MNSNNYDDLLNIWHIHTLRKSHAHASLAARSRFFRNIIGTPSVILSTIVGTAVFAELQDTNIPEGFVITMILLAASLSALQTFYNLGEREQLHKLAEKKYSITRRHITSLIYKNSSHVKDNDISEVERMLNEANETEPSIPDKIWNKMCTKYSSICNDKYSSNSIDYL